MRRTVGSILLVVAIVMFTIPVRAQTAAPTAPVSPLLAMLTLIPDTADTHAADRQGVSFADYRALEAAQGVNKPTANWDVNTQNMYFHALRRISTGADLSNYLSYLKDSSRLVGFNWSDVDQAIQIGNAPRTALLLAGNFDATAIGTALKSRNFEQVDFDGVSLWKRFEDGEITVNAAESGDPFGGELGKAARIALLPGFIANSSYTDLTTQFIAAYQHKQASLAQSNDYRILAAAITDPQIYSGQLIQALFVEPAIFSHSQPPDGSKIDPSTYGTLPPFTLGVLADRQEATAQVHLIALYYSDIKMAQQASVELGKRIAGFDINQMYEHLNVTVDPPRVYQDSTGKAAAIISVHYDLPSATPDPSGTPTIAPGFVYSRWIQAIYRRNFTPLDTGQ